MTTSQLTVSAIRQHFESYTGYPETANPPNIRPKHVMPSESESETTTQKKQPPKTRPKPKTAIAHCGDAVKSAGDSGAPSQSVAQYELQSSGDANDQCTGTDNVSASLSNFSNASQLPTILRACECTETKSPSLSKQLPASNFPSDDRRRVSVSRDESDIVDPSVKRTVLSRWTSASSLLSDTAAPSADDVREAINKAKQKRVLQRIVGMKLEGENLPQQIREGADDDRERRLHFEIVDVKEHSQKNKLTCETQTGVDVHSPSSLISTADSKSVAISTDGASNSTSTPAATSEPNSLSDALEQNVEPGSAMPKLLLTEETTSKNEETESESRVVSGHVSQQTRRPISLYPQDIELASVEIHRSPTVTDIHSPANAHQLSANDDCTPATIQSDRQAGLPRNAQEQTTFNLTSVKHPHVAPSRKSYLVIKEFVGENFSFLDDLDNTVEMPVSINDCGEEQTISPRPTSSTDSSADEAATAELCTRDRRDELEQTTEKTHRNERAKSLLRKSIVLPNGEILEIIGRAFTFLDDYDDQIVHD